MYECFLGYNVIIIDNFNKIINMKLSNLIALVAAAYGYNYITKKDAFGKSKLDCIKENTPDWIDKAKKIGKDAIDKLNKNSPSANYNNQGF